MGSLEATLLHLTTSEVLCLAVVPAARSAPVTTNQDITYIFCHYVSSGDLKISTTIWPNEQEKHTPIFGLAPSSKDVNSPLDTQLKLQTSSPAVRKIEYNKLFLLQIPSTKRRRCAVVVRSKVASWGGADCGLWEGSQLKVSQVSGRPSSSGILSSPSIHACEQRRLPSPTQSLAWPHASRISVPPKG
ncbi:hypothetical protein R3P38DRAFT_2805551 [Favolaschia claudopus]|uniref:Uncharacterized protein n=1 Tax=Favolaschia claudopus TaxID=2862362 RepID=A0AAV9ZMN0_9AGAR